MRNLKHYTGDSFAFYETVVSKIKKRRKDPDYKNRITSQKTNIQKLFAEFDKSFSRNSLEKLASYGYDEDSTKDLNKLYTYKGVIFQKLRDDVTTTSTGRSSKVCQCCTIGEVNSFDHILPKKKFAEYSVHPRNLLPSCSKCNGHKNDSKSTTKAFLNLYLDNLPNEQYLFVELSVISKIAIEVRFYLDNPNGIDNKMFALIKSHYKKLDLCKRFAEHTDDVVSDLVNAIENNLGELPLNRALRLAKGQLQKDKMVYGYNFWPLILQEELLRSKKFIVNFSTIAP